MRKLFGLAVLAAVLIAGCGSSAPHKTVPPQAPIRCSPTDTAEQCVLGKLPAPPAPGLTGTFSLQGVDFAWTKIAPSQAGSFGASYLSTDPSKNWNRALINAYHAAGKGTVAVWETSGTRAADGCAAGAADARAGEALLASYGFPRSHEDLAIDFDATGPQIASYFRCAAAAEPGLVGAYGGYRPLQYLCANHITTLNWQTYAWSGGLWLPASCAPLEQYLNGSTFDHDRAIDANYGQFPAPGPVGPSHATITHWRTARNSSFTVYHDRHCSNGLAHDKSHTQDHCYLFARRVVYFQERLWTVYPRWHVFGPHARKRSLIAWIIRPSVSIWSHERASTEARYLKAGCQGPVSFPQPSDSRLCKRLAQRAHWFDTRATSTVKAYP